MRAIEWTWRLITRNLLWKLLSLVIAAVIWALVANEPELLTQMRVGVEYKNLPDYMEINSELASTINLELSGRSGELRGLNDIGLRPEVILDMSHVHPGTTTYRIGDGNVKLPHGVRLVRAIPARVTVTVTTKKS
jgi:hypothetical protein